MHVFNARPGQMGLHLPEAQLIDNFAGGGGASMGIEMATGRPVDIAINHNAKALGMHHINHPYTDHYCESVWSVDPVKACNGVPVQLAWFSPDCTHFSKARGGTPKKKEIRGLAWVAVKWMLEVRPEIVPLENVEEFRTWGPLNEYSQPIKERAGETFNAFMGIITTGIETDHPGYIECLEFLGLEASEERAQQLANGLGYQVEFKELRACDFGAPTTRKRFFMVARCDGLPICWPEPTHGDPKSLEVQSGKLKPYQTAAECIDWSIPVKSIFSRKKPLAKATEERIARGLKKFVFEADEPFTIPAEQVAPFITECANASNQRNMPADQPLRTITAHPKGGTFAVIAPVIERQFSQSECNAADQPLGTITAGGGGKSALVQAFLAKHYGGNYTGAGVDMAAPLDTITTTDHHALVSSNLVKLRNTNTGSPLTDPVHTITAGGTHIGEVRAFLMKYYSEGGQWASLDDPMHTIPTKDRIGLVIVKGELYRITDIGMRMLQPHELYKAQGFPDGYIHTHYIDEDGKEQKLTKTDQVRMCGNSVSPVVAAAIVKANLAAKEKQEAA